MSHQFDPAKVQIAREKLAAAAATVTPYSHGFTADDKAIAEALDALLDAGVGAQAADRIAVEEWKLPPTRWNVARGVQPKSMGCYDYRVAKRIPQQFKK